MFAIRCYQQPAWWLDFMRFVWTHDKNSRTIFTSYGMALEYAIAAHMDPESYQVVYVNHQRFNHGCHHKTPR